MEMPYTAKLWRRFRWMDGTEKKKHTRPRLPPRGEADGDASLPLLSIVNFLRPASDEMEIPKRGWRQRLWFWKQLLQ